MKSSNLVIIIIGAVLIVILFMVFSNERKSINERFGNNVGYVSDVELLNKSADFKKVKERNKIVMFGTAAILILGVAFFFFHNDDNKKDPFKNLDLLKHKELLTDEEFVSKKLEVLETEKQKLEAYREDKEIKKLVSALDNLKNKGILSEEEYNKKLNLIDPKYRV